MTGAVSQDRITGLVLLSVWQLGPLRMEQLHEAVPEAGGLQIVQALVQLRAEDLVYLNDGPVDPLYEAGGMDEEAAKKRYAELSGDRACVLCSCTDVWGCAEGCSWTAEELCSSCAF